MIHLLNGNKSERVRNSEGCTVLPCGCASTDVQWLQMCDAHFKQWEQLHAEGRRENP